MGDITNWIGIDDHADKWTIVHYRGWSEEPEREWELVPGESGYRKLIGWLKEMEGKVRVAYEAGPCGYEMYRQLRRSQVECVVAAPSLTPTKPGDRVKTNRRDARKIGRAYRAGELTLITVPDARQESVRDLVRAREAAQEDVLRARHQLSKLLLRYGHRDRDGQTWTGKHWSWIAGVKLEQESSAAVMRQLVTTIQRRVEVVADYDRLIAEVAASEQYAPLVAALTVLRGVALLTAMTILVELGDLRRFQTAPQLMAALGLVPSEYSTGDKVRHSSITKTGNAHVRRVLVEAAWQYQRPLRTGKRIKDRRNGKAPELVALAEKCDSRLHRRFIRLTSRGKRSTVAAVAVARELAGFIWALGQKLY
ncbi:MAG TPA: IS110 family transposase [Thermoanaerobaculia bacterium]|jgi:transposase